MACKIQTGYNAYSKNEQSIGHKNIREEGGLKSSFSLTE